MNLVRLHIGLYPVDEGGHLGVDRRALTAARYDSPGYDSNDFPYAVAGADQWTTRVTLWTQEGSNK